MFGKISVGVRRAARPPKMRIMIARTANVYGRLRAMRTMAFTGAFALAFPGSRWTLSLSRSSRSLQDELGNLVWMGDQRQVACLHFNSPGAHTLCHEAFKIRIDGAVLSRHSIETWLRPPSRLGSPACQQSLIKWFLDGV